MEATVTKNGIPVLQFAIANGFRNIQNIVQKLKRKKCGYQFVEIMACPGGCLNGGAQARPDDVTKYKEVVTRLAELYAALEKSDKSEKCYGLVDGPGSDKAKSILHTSYKAVEKMNTALNIKW